MSNIFRPDFIQIPTQVLTDQSLQPLDRVLFGYIYWFTKLKDGQCTASNDTLAALTHTTASTIKNSLMRLERSGWITKVMLKQNYRKEIKCNLSYGKDGSLKSSRKLWTRRANRNQMMTVPQSNDDGLLKILQGKPQSNDAQNNINKNSNKAHGTPRLLPRVREPEKPLSDAAKQLQARLDKIRNQAAHRDN